MADNPTPITISAVPATPAQQEQTALTTEGQRRINYKWESTQSTIALFVVIFGMLTNAFVICILVLFVRTISVEQLAIISMGLQFINLTTGMVTGFYFSRTNHAQIGGVGSKPEPKYEGR